MSPQISQSGKASGSGGLSISRLVAAKPLNNRPSHDRRVRSRSMPGRTPRAIHARAQCCRGDFGSNHYADICADEGFPLAGGRQAVPSFGNDSAHLGPERVGTSKSAKGPHGHGGTPEAARSGSNRVADAPASQWDDREPRTVPRRASRSCRSTTYGTRARHGCSAPGWTWSQ